VVPDPVFRNQFGRERVRPARAGPTRIVGRATVDTAAYLLSSIRRSPKLLLQRETAGFNAAIAGPSAALFAEWADDITVVTR
jgi:hypothetical protein